jgi:hypothetical protein
MARAFNGHVGVPLFQQPPHYQQLLLNVWRSARLLHNWAQTDTGKKQIANMEMAVEKQRSSDDNVAQALLEEMQYQSWLHYLDDDANGSWLARLDQRRQ